MTVPGVEKMRMVFEMRNADPPVFATLVRPSRDDDDDDYGGGSGGGDCFANLFA